eukprot:2278545-Amphidinium_carterae.1
MCIRDRFKRRHSTISSWSLMLALHLTILMVGASGGLQQYQASDCLQLRGSWCQVGNGQQFSAREVWWWSAFPAMLSRCSAAFVSPYALMLTQGKHLEGNNVPGMSVLVGDYTHASSLPQAGTCSVVLSVYEDFEQGTRRLLAETAAIRDVPVVGFESNLKAMDDRSR